MNATKKHDPKLVSELLGLLRHQCAPQVNRRNPYWAPNMSRTFYELDTLVPDWKHELPTDQGPIVTLDKNAAWFSAAASSELAHGILENTGEIEFDKNRPGYWLIDFHHWNHKAIVSPLGRTRLKTGWVATPTVAVLERLTDEGVWPGITIHGSWTTTTRMRLNRPADGGGWSNVVRDMRSTILTELIEEGLTPEEIQAHPRYKGFKDSYAVALEEIRKGFNSPDGMKEHRIYRPDWYHTIVAQHAASHWRKGWDLLNHNLGPVAIGTRDEISFRKRDFIKILDQGLIKIDQTGRTLGAYKIKKETEA